MKTVGGMIYANGRLFRGFVEFDGGIIHDVQEGNPPDYCTARGLVIPLLANCHSHVGDACLRGRLDPNATIDELVRPPDSFKHRALAECEDAVVSDSIGSAIEEMRSYGTRQFIDFRESGIRGVRQLKSATNIHQFPECTILSRPAELSYDEDEVEQLLLESDGIGISSVSDWPADDLQALAGHVTGKGRIFALHASEAEREEIDRVLQLKPSFLVHMSSATEEDLVACAKENLPVVICPRSNLRFGIKIDVSKMLDSGVELCLGTDNAMFHSLSMLDEMRAIYTNRHNSRSVTPQEILKLAVENSQKVLRDKTMISISPGNRCEFMVVTVGSDDSPRAVLDSSSKSVVALIAHGREIWRDTIG